MIIDKIKQDIITAMKNKDDISKNILRVTLGEIELASMKAKSFSDDDAYKIIRKIIKNNEETLSLTIKDKSLKCLPSQDVDRVATLLEENDILEKFLPKNLTVDEISDILKDVKLDENKGKSIGIAIKHIKSLGLNADSSDIKIVIDRIS